MTAESTGPRTVETITDAALALCCKPGDLLKCGIRGEVNFYVPVPTNIAVFAIDAEAMDVTNPYLQYPALVDSRYGVPQAWPEIRMLRISKSDCGEIHALRNVGFGQSLFLAGVKSNSAQQLEEVRPSIKDSDSAEGVPWPLCRFATYPDDVADDVPKRFRKVRMKPLILTIDLLYVGSQDLAKLSKDRPHLLPPLIATVAEALATGTRIDASYQIDETDTCIVALDATKTRKQLTIPPPTNAVKFVSNECTAQIHLINEPESSGDRYTPHINAAIAAVGLNAIYRVLWDKFREIIGARPIEDGFLIVDGDFITYESTPDELAEYESKKTMDRKTLSTPRPKKKSRIEKDGIAYQAFCERIRRLKNKIQRSATPSHV